MNNKEIIKELITLSEFVRDYGRTMGNNLIDLKGQRLIALVNELHKID